MQTINQPWVLKFDGYIRDNTSDYPISLFKSKSVADHIAQHLSDMCDYGQHWEIKKLPFDWRQPFKNRYYIYFYSQYLHNRGL